MIFTDPGRGFSVRRRSSGCPAVVSATANPASRIALPHAYAAATPDQPENAPPEPTLTITMALMASATIVTNSVPG